ncbi:MAG: hypothetical protein PHE47_04540 [Oscillospiraceae bacterium]|nr:hypothetical protein [Oscillospiraceae bacterium]
MVRGVHKKIIEVADTQNEFFERAILIVKEGFRDEDPERLRQKAGDYVSHMGNVALARRKKARFLRNAGKVLVGVMAGVALVLLALFWI